MGKCLLGVSPASHFQHYPQKLIWGMDRHNLSHNSIVTLPSTAMPFGIHTKTHTDLHCIIRGCSLPMMQAWALEHAAGFPAPGLRGKITGTCDCSRLSWTARPASTAMVCSFNTLSSSVPGCPPVKFSGHSDPISLTTSAILLSSVGYQAEVGSKLFSVACHTAMQAEGKKSPAFFSRKGQAKQQ